jgi:iron-sulfur cluster assembly protein
MSEDGFDAATDYVRVGSKWRMFWFVLWFKIWQSQSEDDKIFIDNEITIAVKKIFLYLWNNIRVLWRNKRKRIYIQQSKCK